MKKDLGKIKKKAIVADGSRGGGNGDKDEEGREKGILDAIV